MTTIAIGADHAGFAYKERIKELLASMGVEVRDFGTSSDASTDYPDYAHSVAQAVGSGEASYGILVCGSGIGMSIVANKHAGVRAVNTESVDGAKLARQHNDANVLAIAACLATPFEGGRHQRRVDKIHDLTNL
jgi:ribose 5-phosphate isomerase B